MPPTSWLLAEPLRAGLARGAAGVLASVLAALLVAGARLLRAIQRPRRGAAAVQGRGNIVLVGGASPGRVVAAARAPAPHPGLRGRHQQVQRRGLLDGPRLGEGAAPHRVEYGAWGGGTCHVSRVTAVCCVVLPVAGKAGAPSR